MKTSEEENARRPVRQLAGEQADASGGKPKKKSDSPSKQPTAKVNLAMLARSAFGLRSPDRQDMRLPTGACAALRCCSGNVPHWPC